MCSYDSTSPATGSGHGVATLLIKCHTRNFQNRKFSIFFMLTATAPRISLTTCLVIFISVLSQGQKTIKGKVFNKTTQQPISYANIGVLNSNVGTISNPDGSFSIYIPERLLNDTLLFSSIGFGKKVIALKLLAQEKDHAIYLNEKIVSLKPVIISSNKEKNKTFELGNRSVRGGVLETDTNYAGRALALLIDNKEQKGFRFPAYIEKARLRIFRNNLKSFKFRIRLNDVDSITGQPGEDLLTESIVMESTMRNGWLTFDLSRLNHEVAKPFFVAFEQILDLNDRIAIANEYRDFIAKHPDRLKTDTVEIAGRKEVVQTFTRGGIDLAGTFIAINSSKPAAEEYVCFVRETSFGEWKRVRGIVTATVTLSTQLNAGGNVNTDPPCKESIAICEASKMCAAFMDEHSMNGLQISVSKKNKLVWSGAFGYADAINHIPVTDSTKFRINSISKSMTSLALIKLVSENKLDLDAPVQNYVAGFPAKQYPITTRQLAGHLAGLRDYNENDLADYIRTEHFDNATGAISIFRNDTLLFKPGNQFHYSVFGWNLIGAIIEGISGETYAGYMAKNIWKPLKLQHTLEDDIKIKITNKSKCYDATGQENDLGDLSYKYPAGGLLSTSTDLIKMGNEILHGTYIDPKFKPLLFQTQYTTGKQETGYGLGWYIGKDKNGHRIWYHSGDSFSGSSHLLIYPDDDMVISFLANSQEGAAFDIQHIGELFYKN
jgi:CubicO group peptidase (beta-lactamase class C family)